MKVKTILLIFLLGSKFLFCQVTEEFFSYKLDQNREIKIRLPNNYQATGDVKYPVIVVLDSDYLFGPVVGNIDYQTYWDEMPDCIVVGVNQETTREKDFEYNEETYLPAQGGAAFFEFIGMELLPFIEKNYNTSPFKVIIGHDLSANFINYYILKTLPLFNAYISISPELAKEMPTRLYERLLNVDKALFYYLATSEGDVRSLRKSILNTNTKLQTISNKNLNYRFDDFEDSNHYLLVGQAVPEALNEIFDIYKPISRKEYSEKLLPFSGTAFEYLEKKYDSIHKQYGFKKPVIENDLRAIAAACEKKTDNESLLKLAKLARKTYPESMIGAYYYGIYYEAIGDYKKALQRYHSGLLLKKSDYIDKDLLLDRIDEIN